MVQLKNIVHFGLQWISNERALYLIILTTLKLNDMFLINRLFGAIFYK